MTNYTDLKLRCFTGVAFVALTVFMAGLGALVFSTYLISLIFICAYEWGKLSGLKTQTSVLYAFAIIGFSYVIHTIANIYTPYIYLSAILSLFIGWKKRQFYILAGILSLTSVALVILTVPMFFGSSHWWVFYLVLWGGVIITDVGAYITGRSFGKRKLAPSVSPGKTVEGLLGACVFTGLYYAGFAIYLDMVSSIELSLLKVLYALGVGMLFAFFAQMGDLYQSKMKRLIGVKDSGKLLPGHGGMFDRLDGLLSVLFVVGAVYSIYSVIMV